MASFLHNLKEGILHRIFNIIRFLNSFLLVRAYLCILAISCFLARYTFTNALSIISNILSILTFPDRTLRAVETEKRRRQEMRLKVMLGDWLFSPSDVLRLDTAGKRFQNLPDWPYKSKYFRWCGVRVAYVDEKDPSRQPSGKSVVFVHGNPSWSFLFRGVMPSLLEAGHRVVAVDLIGFGKSDKLLRPELYTLELHVSTVRQLFVELDLRDAILFGHDW
ncbi:hypothetical protein HK104_009051 [Borealophlyctis nickersoniae]|nr:hypothetical protein HK104_009051 [Borealophlyctis nickersoniae]